jgi:hypothetical protein
MRLPRLRQGRKDAEIVQGLVLVLTLIGVLSPVSTADASAISKNFDKIKTNRTGIGYPLPLDVGNLISNDSSGGDFVAPGALGGGLADLPNHQTVDAFNSWAVRVDDPSIPDYAADPVILYLDLGASLYTDGLIVWNSNQGDTAGDPGNPYPWGSGGSGLKRARLYYLDIQDPSWDFDSQVENGTNAWTEITSVYNDGDFNQNNTLTSPAQVRSFTEVQARAFKFVLLEGFGVDSMVKIGEDGDGNAIREAQKIILMGELAFFQSGGPGPPTPPPGPVPEPSSLLVLVGLSSLTIGKNWISKRKR